jgi:hypothetical protein
MTACVIVVLSCLAWVAGISWALFHFLALTPAAGWMLAAGLGFAITVAATVILYEMRHAIDLTDYMEATEFDGLSDLPWQMPPERVRGRMPALRMRGSTC